MAIGIIKFVWSLTLVTLLWLAAAYVFKLYPFDGATEALSVFFDNVRDGSFSDYMPWSFD
ncbi:hypothetical protein [Vibrio barjaei]|uniref:hypothetical protein n=1 Tax=Vibrio barjaei TaxID=1676683 RepID=UPI0022834608|nr:hypothetical protein [Vibrio barjaei]MCY9874778.1 hypothetical protein [Vibrio barjaei]